MGNKRSPHLPIMQARLRHQRRPPIPMLKNRKKNKWKNAQQMAKCMDIPNEHPHTIPTSHRHKNRTRKNSLVSSISNSNVRPFDTHFNLPIISNESFFRSKLSTIGFDIVLCNSDTCPPPSRGGSDAKSKNIVTSLLTAEKKKFQRGKGTNAARTDSQSGITISGDQIIGDLYNDNKQLIPFAISPLGLFGPTINNFLYGTLPPSTSPDKLHDINPSRFPHAARMATRANSIETPSNILQRANDIWKTKHPDKPRQTILQIIQNTRPSNSLHTTIWQRSLLHKRFSRTHRYHPTRRRPTVQVIIQPWPPWLPRRHHFFPIQQIRHDCLVKRQPNA